jgi:hypothetical protein
VKAKVLEQLEEVCGESLYCDIRELEALCGSILQNRHIHTNQVHRYTTTPPFYIILCQYKELVVANDRVFNKRVPRFRCFLQYGLERNY